MRIDLMEMGTEEADTKMVQNSIGLEDKAKKTTMEETGHME